MSDSWVWLLAHSLTHSLIYWIAQSLSHSLVHPLTSGLSVITFTVTLHCCWLQFWFSHMCELNHVIPFDPKKSLLAKCCCSLHLFALWNLKTTVVLNFKPTIDNNKKLWKNCHSWEQRAELCLFLEVDISSNTDYENNAILCWLCFRSPFSIGTVLVKREQMPNSKWMFRGCLMFPFPLALSSKSPLLCKGHQVSTGSCCGQ